MESSYESHTSCYEHDLKGRMWPAGHRVPVRGRLAEHRNPDIYPSSVENTFASADLGIAKTQC